MEPRDVSQTGRSEYMEQLQNFGTSKKGTSLVVKDGKLEQIGRIRTLINKIKGEEPRLSSESDTLQKTTLSFLQKGLENKWLTNSHKTQIQTIAERAGLSETSEYKELLAKVDSETKSQLEFYKYIQQDINKAIEGDSNAIYNLGTAFYRRYEKTQNSEDLKEGKKWLEKGKDAGDEAATVKLAEIAAKEGDKLLSVNLYAHAAQSGKLHYIQKSAEEWFKFGDFDEAIKQWKRAAEEKHDPISMIGLAKFYEDGHKGYPKDMEKAREWYIKAAALHNTYAELWLKQHPQPEKK